MPRSRRGCSRIFQIAAKAPRFVPDCLPHKGRLACFLMPIFPRRWERRRNWSNRLQTARSTSHLGRARLDRGLIGIHQPWRREQAGRAFNLLVRIATGLPFWDTQCGFKAFRLDVCRPILKAAHLDGFAFDVELLYLAQHAGLRIREIPVRWNHAEGSKVQFFKDSLRMLREVISLRARA